jgi:hypothetical protein
MSKLFTSIAAIGLGAVALTAFGAIPANAATPDRLTGQFVFANTAPKGPAYFGVNEHLIVSGMDGAASHRWAVDHSAPRSMPAVGSFGAVEIGGKCLSTAVGVKLAPCSPDDRGQVFTTAQNAAGNIQLVQIQPGGEARSVGYDTSFKEWRLRADQASTTVTTLLGTEFGGNATTPPPTDPTPGPNPTPIAPDPTPGPTPGPIDPGTPAPGVGAAPRVTWVVSQGSDFLVRGFADTGALVMADDADGRGIAGTSAGDGGRFELRIPGRYAGQRITYSAMNGRNLSETATSTLATMGGAHDPAAAPEPGNLRVSTFGAGNVFVEGTVAVAADQWSSTQIAARAADGTLIAVTTEYGGRFSIAVPQRNVGTTITLTSEVGSKTSVPASILVR